MLDTSGISLSASDPNPTIDQTDDLGSSFDFSSFLNTATQWGTEIAGMVTGRPVAVSPSGVIVGTPGGGSTGGLFPTAPKPPMSTTTKLLLVGLVAGGVVVAVRMMGSK